MDQERFKRLKLRADKVISDLTHLPGDGSTIHKKDRFRCLIAGRVFMLEREGELVCNDGPHYKVYRTLDSLEEAISEAELWVGKRR